MNLEGDILFLTGLDFKVKSINCGESSSHTFISFYFWFENLLELGDPELELNSELSIAYRDFVRCRFEIGLIGSLTTVSILCFLED